MSTAIKIADELHSFDGVVKVDFLKVRKVSLIIRALNHSIRESILNIINEKNRTTVTEIYTRLNLEQSIASQHLALLRKAGILKTEKEKKFVYYSINKEKLDIINVSILQFID